MSDLFEESFEIPSRIEDACRAREKLLQTVQSRSFPTRACFSIQLALEEALANAIWHGNGGDPARKVQISCRVDDTRFEITICDEGPGFDPRKTPNPTDETNIGKSHGRGVLLIQSYMDEVRYNERGNCLTMVKYRSSLRPIVEDTDPV